MFSLTHCVRYYFVHVPKTGGTTLLLSFVQANTTVVRCMARYSQRHCAVISGAGDLQDPFGAKFLLAHAPVTSIVPATTCTFSLLRHPFKRIVSYFNYLDRIHTASAFNDFIRGRQGKMMQNQMTAFIAGLPSGPRGVTHQLPTRSHLDTAMANLVEHLSFFGFTEDFDQVLSDLKTFGVDNDILRNPTVKKPRQHGNNPSLLLSSAAIATTVKEEVSDFFCFRACMLVEACNEMANSCHLGDGL